MDGLPHIRIQQSVFVGAVLKPLFETGFSYVRSLRMRLGKRSSKELVATSFKLSLYRLENKATSILDLSINLLKKAGRHCNCDS